MNLGGNKRKPGAFRTDSDTGKSSDLALIKDVQAGADLNAALATLYQRHGNRVLAFLLSRAGNRSDAEDFAQQTWLKVAKALPQFSGNHLASWLITIAKNTMISEFRKRSVRSAINGQAIESVADITISEESTDNIDRLRGCLEKLKFDKPDFFRVVELKLAGNRHDEIANQMGIAAKTSMSRFDRAKGYLRICLEEK